MALSVGGKEPLALIILRHANEAGTCAKGATISGALVLDHKINALSQKEDTNVRKQPSKIYGYSFDLFCI